MTGTVTKESMRQQADNIRNPADRARFIEIIDQIEFTRAGTYVDPALIDEIDGIRKRNQ